MKRFVIDGLGRAFEGVGAFFQIFFCKGLVWARHRSVSHGSIRPLGRLEIRKVRG